MAGGVLALDLATNAGWACGRLPARGFTPMEAATTRPPQPASGFTRIGRPGCSVGAFGDAASRWISGLLREHRPAGLIYEKPILPPPDKDGNARTNPTTVMKLNGLVCIVLMEAHRAGISWVREAQPSTVKKYMCGKGGPGKGGVMGAVSAMGWRYGTDDEADALALWCFAADLYYRERNAA